MDFHTAISLFESPQDDVSDATRVSDLARKIVDALYHGTSPDAEIVLSSDEYFLFSFDTLGIDDDVFLDTALLITKAKSPQITGAYATFNLEDGSEHHLLDRYKRAVIIYGLRTMDETKISRMAGTVAFNSVVSHELVHLLDGVNGKIPQKQTSKSINKKSYYNDPAEFNAYYHDVVSILTNLAIIPQEQMQDYMEIYDVTGDFKKDLPLFLKGDRHTSQFIRWLADERRKSLLRRIYKLYQHVMERKNEASMVTESVGPYLPATKENIKKARDFVYRKWCERAQERGLKKPVDLSYSCKFSSMFAQRVFGGTIQGNYDHQFLVLPSGKILDLNADAKDVQDIDDPYHHDPDFWGNRDHIESMQSCEPRVDAWVNEFRKELI